MPGFSLQASCPCGFETTWLTVDANLHCADRLRLCVSLLASGMRRFWS